jgi:hypothetical protein
MLISMPQGTSTIFGAFQAILALLCKGDVLPPSLLNYSLMKSSPVNSSGKSSRVCPVAVQQVLWPLRVGDPNQRGINGSFPFPHGTGWAGRYRWLATSDKELVRMDRLSIRTCRPHWSRMPRYFFNTRIGDELIDDPEGEELRNPDRAWEVARAMILELIKTEGADGVLLNAVIEVTDDDGEIVLEFPFSEALIDVPDASMTKH